MTEIERLQRELAAEKERADYAWRNTTTIERARQEEMAKRDSLTQQRDELLAAVENLIKVKGRHHTEQAYKRLEAAVAKAKQS